ncbi:hypothetical protein [Carboxylicivirga linearis]|uniref:YcxB-like protein domain-containing protein n=1 Tax=Carboxylicivirga linearis TaxID=1628157 RepID=A0ABS5JVU0_9BACT|nr:hypothetical protein [Carboxylicivirga linearis]MBS2099007.1 hypothetical protein [Carboxylicivirga linearis]
MKFFDYITQKFVSEIRLSEKYAHKHPQEVKIRYNNTKYWIKTAIAFGFTELLLLSELDNSDKKHSTEYFIIVIIGGLILVYFIVHNFIRAINNKPVIEINDSGIKIKEDHYLTWDSIKSISTKEEHNEESVDWILCIESKDFNWQDDFTAFNMRMDEISHWLAYFKLKHIEKKTKTPYNKLEINHG